jgi:hypothetical protein
MKREDSLFVTITAPVDNEENEASSRTTGVTTSAQRCGGCVQNPALLLVAPSAAEA